jgi:hypothetical protein
MKKIAIIIAALFTLFSCKQKSLGDKLQNVIEDYETGSEHVEHLKIDSFRYSLTSLQNYYLQFSDIENQYANELDDIKKQGWSDNLFPLIASTSHDILIARSKQSFFLDLATKTASEPQVYEIDYYADYQTDKSNFQGHQTKFLYAKNLEFVKINVDSIYQLDPKAVSEKYDSIRDVQILIKNDSLENLSKKLNRELQLKIIAGEINQEGIFAYRKRILDIDGEVADSKVQYSFLY